MRAAGIAGENKGRLFCSMHKGDKLTAKPMSRFDVGFTDRVILLADRRQGHALGAVEGPLRLELAAWLIRSQTVIAIAAISIAVRRPRMNAIAVAHPAVVRIGV
jgi:hypothetical protein